MRRLLAIICIFIFVVDIAFCKTQQEEYQNDYLYSAEYFDYLIECAENDKEEMQKEAKIQNQNKISDIELINLTQEEYIPFKLQIKQDEHISPFKDSYKKIDTKTIIPINKNFSAVYNNVKTRNKYNSNDYKILTGAEYNPVKYLNIASGLETNFRGLDQNPTSRKFYINPSLKLNDKLSITFLNKMNILNSSTDHDIGINLSPFKSKIADFRLYSGLTKAKDGNITESINFTTNLYF